MQQVKFKSGISKYLIAALVFFNVIIILLLTTKFYVTSMLPVKIGIVLLVFDLFLFIPMLFFTYYEFKEDLLYIHDYPFRKYKIKYEDIFNVEDGDFETHDKTNKVSLSLDRVAVGYKKLNKKQEEETRYIFISPDNMSLFLIRLSGRLTQHKEEIEAKSKLITAKQAEHEKKKKLADEQRKKEAEENAPEIIRVSGLKKLGKAKPKFAEKEVSDDEQPSETENQGDDGNDQSK